MTDRKFGLTGNQLKLIAMISMTCDHVGLSLFPQLQILRIIGRLALPIYAFMIAEGCRHTRNRRKYLLSISALALLCQLVYWFMMGSLYQCILVTFSLSVCLIYALDYAVTSKTLKSRLVAVLVSVAVVFFSVFLGCFLPPQYNYAIDYGIWGILIPVVIYFAPTAYRLPAMTLAMIPLCASYGGVQWYAYLALVLLLLYNGQRGRAKMKNLFYIYYPAHLVAIYLMGFLLQ